MTTRAPLLPLLRRYIERDPATAAHLLETLEEAEAETVLKAFPPALCASVFPHLQATHAARLLARVPPDLFTSIVRQLSPEQVTAILITLDGVHRQAILAELTEDMRRQVQELLVYPENSAGRIMSTDVLAFHSDVRVRDAIQRIRTLAGRHAPATYAYVVDPQERLVGVLNMRDLLLATGDATLEAIMKTDVVAVDGFMDREEVAHLLSSHRYFAVPVVDRDRRLLGILRSDQLIEDVREEGVEDLLKMVGAGSDEETFSPVAFAMRKRLPWLGVNLCTAFLAASVVALFEDTIAKVTILAVFLPVVAGQGGNAGAQSLAIVFRGLVLREIRRDRAFRLIGKETLLGALNGAVIGLVTALIAWWWHHNPFLGLVIGLAMLVNLTAAGLAGAAIPLLLKACRLDPAQSSSILLTTVTDVVGFFAFLGFAVLFLPLLS